MGLMEEVFFPGLLKAAIVVSSGFVDDFKGLLVDE